MFLHAWLAATSFIDPFGLMHALKTIGTPAQLFIYAGEGHRFRKLTDLEDLRARIIGWYDRYLK